MIHILRSFFSGITNKTANVITVGIFTYYAFGVGWGNNKYWIPFCQRSSRHFFPPSTGGELPVIYRLPCLLLIILSSITIFFHKFLGVPFSGRGYFASICSVCWITSRGIGTIVGGVSSGVGVHVAAIAVVYNLNVGALNAVSKLYYKGVKGCSKMVYVVNKIKFLSAKMRGVWV